MLLASFNTSSARRKFTSSKQYPTDSSFLDTTFQSPVFALCLIGVSISWKVMIDRPFEAAASVRINYIATARDGNSSNFDRGVANRAPPVAEIAKPTAPKWPTGLKTR